MPTYLDFKNQLQGLEDVHDTVKTVEKIAASHLKLVRRQAEDFRIKTSKVAEMIKMMSQYTSIPSHFHKIRTKDRRSVALILTSDRGIVGAIYHQLFDQFLEAPHEYDEYWVVGTKGLRLLQQADFNELRIFGDDIDPLDVESQQQLVLKLVQAIRDESVYQFDVYFSNNVMLYLQIPSMFSLLPLTPESILSLAPTEITLGLPVFEGAKKSIMSEMIWQFIQMQLMSMVVQSKFSELSARMVNSEHAAAKAEEMVGNLTMSYLRFRRHTLTQQQLASYAAHFKYE